MRVPRIPETDLARIAVLAPELQPSQLQALKDFRPPYSLDPFRRIVGDLVNLQFGLLDGHSSTDWSVIESLLRKSCRTQVELDRNLSVAKALHDFVTERGVVSYSRPASRWSVGYEHSVAFWGNFYSVLDDRPAFFHFDPRKTKALDSEARRFALSMMHQRLRIEDPDFAEANLFVLRFGERKDGERFVRSFSAADVDLFSYDQLTEMVDVTYQLWIAELQRRARAARRDDRGSGSLGL